jgi:ankyrin repeat protein
MSTSPNHLSIPCDETIINSIVNIQSTKSMKLFSHGRGLAAHLHAVHTPWNPGKAELKRRMALTRQLQNNKQKLLHTIANKIGNDSGDHDDTYRPIKRAKSELNSYHESIPSKWDPSKEEIDQWNQRVSEIVKLVELQTNNTQCEDADPTNKQDMLTQKSLDYTPENRTTGIDRSGNLCPSYRESLPTFLAAAADGDIVKLQACVNSYEREYNDSSLDCKMLHIKRLLSTHDRNGSTAEHWAAGGGHVHCLAYLIELRDLVNNKATKRKHESITVDDDDNSSALTNSLHKKIRRRRDGKTSLHYASRNGHIACIDLIMSRSDAPSINIPSGDGTTPLHMACYGGHPSTVRHLVDTYHANVHAINAWSCGAAHWSAMSLGEEGMDAVVELCNYLREHCGVDFVAKQKQGHTPLHKACSKKNRAVIEWLAGKYMNAKGFSEDEMKQMSEPDKGGNIPSDIWLSVGGDASFASWMKDECGW